jgi:hypothetical protein
MFVSALPVRGRLILFAALLSLFACASAPSKPARTPLASGEFVASSLSSDFFAMVAEFRGRYLVYPESIVLTDVVAAVVLRDVSAYRGPRALEAIEVGLGQYTGAMGKDGPVWRMMRPRSQPASVELVMKPGDRQKIEGLTLTIPVSDPHQLHSQWLIFSLFTSQPGGSAGESFVHSDRQLFALLSLPR